MMEKAISLRRILTAFIVLLIAKSPKSCRPLLMQTVDAFSPQTRHHEHPAHSAFRLDRRDDQPRHNSFRVFSSNKTYDIIIVGGGSAGLTAAKFASTFKKSVALIESSKLGGDCTWTGCVPSKTLLAAAKRVWNWRKLNKQFGVKDNEDVPMYKLLEDVKKQIDENRERIYEEDDSPQILQSMGIDVVSGKAFFCDARTVEVTPSSKAKYHLTAKYGLVIATGATPRHPGESIGGINSVPYWTYENLWTKFFESMEQRHASQQYKSTKPRIIVVGGGPIGCELSQALSRLGCSITIISKSSRLLPMEDIEASVELQQVLEEEGINVICGESVASVCPDYSPEVDITNDGNKGVTENGSIMVTLDSKTSIIGDHILLATGRVPNTRNMGLENLGVQISPNTKGIEVDGNLETGVKGIYAAGDCTGDRQFTHYAGFQGAIAARNILLPLSDVGVLEDVPSTIFTDPEVASIGLTEQASYEEYGKNAVSISFKNLTHVDRAICENTYEHGFIKIIHHAKSNQILGATIMAPVAGELISELAVAQQNKISLDKLATVTHSYPSYSIALQQIAADVYYEKLKKWSLVYNILKWIGL